jgi:hypothetical protein
MTIEEFEQKQAAISNEDLIELAEQQVSQLAESGGRSHRMSVPPKITDTDMIFSELIQRYRAVISNPSNPK